MSTYSYTCSISEQRQLSNVIFPSNRKVRVPVKLEGEPVGTAEVFQQGHIIFLDVSDDLLAKFRQRTVTVHLFRNAGPGTTPNEKLYEIELET